MSHSWGGGVRTPRLRVPLGGVAGRGVRFKGRAPPPRGRRERRCSGLGLGGLDPSGLRERCAEEPGGGGAEPGRGGGQRH